MTPAKYLTQWLVLCFSKIVRESWKSIYVHVVLALRRWNENQYYKYFKGYSFEKVHEIQNHHEWIFHERKLRLHSEMLR